ncbi:MAG: hypothetical protein HY365_03630 [Candidatus Aenigmarchaeota archaeon]|nr:hypothetical protein [Candidatus Aenigmarchaeota archaeon]
MKPNKLNPKVVSFSLVAVTMALSLACAVLLALAPKAALGFFGSIFHGIDLTKIAAPVTASGVLTSIVATGIVAFVSGWLFATAYNYFLRKAK